MDAASLLAGLMLPWVLGVAALAALRDASRPPYAPGEVAWILGAGFLAGAFLLTLWMRTLSLAGIRFGVPTIGAPLLLATAGMFVVAWRRHGRDASTTAIVGALRAMVSPPGAARAIRIAWQLMLAWMAIRYMLLAFEVLWRPLYPWDSWIQWATKARVWYDQGAIVPFARSEAWFAIDVGTWTDASPYLPPTMPLLQVWPCIALGRWDDSLMNVPWWQFSVALTLAVYGALRSADIEALPALFGAYLVASLPLANVHVALAGYADLPLAAYYTAAALALLRWTASRSPRDAGLALLFAVACTQVQVPGVLWALTLLPGVVIALRPRQGTKVVAIGSAVALFALVALTKASPEVFGHRLHLDFDPEWNALGESTFLLGNWHLLWYAVAAAALLAWRRLASPALAPLAAVVAAGGVFLVAVFSFTGTRLWMTEHATMSRASLHLAPLAVVFTVLAFREFAGRWAESRAPSAPPVHDAPPAA